MRHWLPAASACLLVVAVSAGRQGPVGEWRVADGSAHLRIVDCDSVLWGVVSWEDTAGFDVHNPNPALRTRPTLGMPVLVHMTPSGTPMRWRGHVYNARNGKTYTASIRMHGPDTLRVRGCTLHILCGGEYWTRLSEGADTAAVAATPSPATAPAAAICARVQVGAGEGRRRP